MLYDCKKYKLNSYRTGFINNNKLYNKINIFFNCSSQSSDIDNIEYYNSLYKSGHYNLILLPLDLNGKESGDNYEIYQYYENILKTEFIICEKLYFDHIFFKDFGSPIINFTNYTFDQKLKFIKKTNDIKEAINV
jgi:hypothetical protein